MKNVFLVNMYLPKIKRKRKTFFCRDSGVALQLCRSECRPMEKSKSKYPLHFLAACQFWRIILPHALWLPQLESGGVCLPLTSPYVASPGISGHECKELAGGPNCKTSHRWENRQRRFLISEQKHFEQEGLHLKACNSYIGWFCR